MCMPSCGATPHNQAYPSADTFHVQRHIRVGKRDVLYGHVHWIEVGDIDQLPLCFAPTHLP